MKLRELSAGAKLRVETKEGMQDAIFGHLDGIYSYCYIERNDCCIASRKVFHLHNSQELILRRGRWELV